MPYEKSRQIEERFGRAINLIKSGCGASGQLGAALGVSRPTVQRIVAELKRRGYGIRSIHDADGWKYEIIHTPPSDTSRVGL